MQSRLALGLLVAMLFLFWATDPVSAVHLAEGPLELDGNYRTDNFPLQEDWQTVVEDYTFPYESNLGLLDYTVTDFTGKPPSDLVVSSLSPQKNNGGQIHRPREFFPLWADF